MVDTFNIKIPLDFDGDGTAYTILSGVDDTQVEEQLSKAHEIVYHKIYLLSLPLILIPVDVELLNLTSLGRLYQDIYLIPQTYRTFLIRKAKTMLINESLCITCLGDSSLKLNIERFENMFDSILETSWLSDQYRDYGLQVFGVPNQRQEDTDDT